MTAAVERAIADLKRQFEKAVARWQKPGDAIAPVEVAHPADGHWSFLLHSLRTVDCKLDPPHSLWLANKKISTRAADLCLVGARYRGENLLVYFEMKHFGKSTVPEPDWFSFPGLLERTEEFSEPARCIAAKRSWRALRRVLASAPTHNVEQAASESSDLAVVVRALEQPEAIETLREEDPFAASRLRGLREREHLLSQEGGTWTAEQVAKHLHLTRQTVNLRRKQGTLLGLDAGRHGFRYPAWQFTRGGTIEGLEESLTALKHLDPWMQQAFILGQNTRLREKRPIDVLRARDVAEVVKAALAFGEHGAA